MAAGRAAGGDRARPGLLRDHTLFCVSELRTHGIPARSRVGFAGYFRRGGITITWSSKHGSRAAGGDSMPRSTA